MSIKTATSLAFVGMILVTISVLIDLAVNVTGVIGGVVASIILLRSLIYTFASLSLVVLLYIFRKSH